MKVSFIAKSKRISFTAKPSKKRCPKHLKKFLFKAGSPKLKRIQVKARKGYRAWKRSH